MFKRVISVLFVVFALVLFVACDQKTDPTKPPTEVVDTTPPLITVPSSTLKHLAGEEVDLLQGVSAIDDKDGIVTPIISDLGGYDKNVAGTYTVTYKATDAAGNSSTGTRTVIVEENFARIEIDGNYYRAKLNPQILPAYTNTGYHTAFDTSYVNVLTTEYVRYLLETDPVRFGQGTGWSIIYVADSDGKLVYARDFLTNEFWLDEEGYLMTKVGTDWSTGTPTGINNEWSSSEKGLGVANIGQHLVDGGYLILFLNDGVNAVDSARVFGANNLVDHENNLKGLGETIEIKGMDMSEFASYTPTKPFPIIQVPGFEYVDTNKVHRLNTTKVAYAGDPIPDLLEGVVATDGKGVDITNSVTFEIFEFESVSNPKGDKVNLANILDEEHIGKKLLVVYKVTANTYTEELSILLDIKADRPDHLEVDAGDTLFSVILGEKFELDFNNADALKSENGVANLLGLETAQIFNKEDYLNALEAALGTNDHNGDIPFINHGVVVILDTYGNLYKVRVSKGGMFEINILGHLKTTDLTFTQAVDAANGGGLLKGLEDEIPNGGYVVIYPETDDKEAINYALENLYDKNYDGGNIVAASAKVAVRYPVLFAFEQRIITAVESFFINDGVVTVKINDLDAFFNGGSGANMRLGAYNDIALVYDKDGFIAAIDKAENVASNATNGGIPLLSNGAVIILDANKEIVVVRMATQSTDHAVEILKDGTLKVHDENFVWNATHANNADFPNGLMKDIKGLIPEGGMVVIFPLSGNSNMRDFAIRRLFNPDYVSGAITTDSEAANFDTNGFAYDAAYYNALVFKQEKEGTDILKPARISRPKVYVEDDIIVKWNEIENAGSYEVYINGVKVETTEDTEIDLSNVLSDAGEYSVYVRALAEDLELHSNSVISNKLELELSLEDLKIISTPEIEVDGDEIVWEAPAHVKHYEVYLEVAGTAFKVAEVNVPKFSPEAVSEGLEGNNYYYIKAISNDDDFKDSQFSNKVLYKVDFVTDKLEVAGVETQAAFVTAENYFLRRNATDETKLENYLYVVTGIYEHVTAEKAYTEAFSVVALLDRENNVKFVRSIFNPQTYTSEDGWFADADYTTNAAQLAKLDEHVSKGDVLVIGKNGLKVDFKLNDEAQNIDAREFLAYLVVNPWAGFPAVAVAPNGWRAPMAEFIEAKDVVFDFETFEGDPRILLAKPANFDIQGTVVSWDAVENASAYEIYIDEVKEATVNVPSFDTKDIYNFNELTVNVIAVSDSDDYSDSETASFIMEDFITVGDHTLRLYTSETLYYIETRNTNPYASATEIYYLPNAGDILTLPQEDLAKTFTANATVLLVDSTGKIKLVRTIIGNFQWLATNDEGVDNGWVAGGYASGAYTVETLKQYIADGDQLLIAKSAAKQAGLDITTRDALALYYQVEWDYTAGGSEGWRGGIGTFLNPKDVTFVIERTIR